MTKSLTSENAGPFRALSTGDVPLAGVVVASGVLGNLPIAVSPALIVAANATGLDGAIVGIFATIFMGMSSLAGLATAPFAHRIPPRHAVLGCFMLFVMVNALAALFPSNSGSFAALGFAGASAGMAAAIAARLIAQSPTPDTIAARVGIWGAIVLIVCGGAAAWAAQFGMTGVHATIAIAALIAAPATLTLPTSPPPRSTQNSLRDIDYRAALLLMGALLYSTKDGVAWSLSQTIAIQHGFSANAQAILLASIGFIGVLGAGFAVLCSKRYGWLVPSCIAVTANIIFGTFQYVVSDNTLFSILVCVYTASHIFLIPFLLGLASALDANGRLVAAMTGIFTMGSAIGPILGMQLLATGGTELISVVMLVTTLSAACLWIAPAKRRFAFNES